ncbi:MAG: hypothetical protein KBE65_19685 [Phycisphaerae bacterium]|nr:hypothetical protein [Phycisphaerae bacterium]
MSTAHSLLGLAIACALWNVVAGILICIALSKRGVKINYLFLKALMPWYAHRYKIATLQETGEVGPLFYRWLISINAALVAGIAGVLALWI